MILNVIKNSEGKTIQWTDTEDNRITKVDNNWIYKHFCSECESSTKNMDFIKETGRESRTVVMKCKCGKIVKYHG